MTISAHAWREAILHAASPRPHPARGQLGQGAAARAPSRRHLGRHVLHPASLRPDWTFSAAISAASRRTPPPRSSPRPCRGAEGAAIHSCWFAECDKLPAFPDPAAIPRRGAPNPLRARPAPAGARGGGGGRGARPGARQHWRPGCARAGSAPESKQKRGRQYGVQPVAAPYGIRSPPVAAAWLPPPPAVVQCVSGQSSSAAPILP